MAYTQLITATPSIYCRPGWCLEYVRGTYRLPADVAYPTAISNWLKSPTKHQDRNFPDGMWTPIWFTLKYEPAGHVALLAPDGSVYSSSSPISNLPVHHSSLDALIAYYARANPLTYLGWTEDIQGIKVMEETMDKSNLILESALNAARADLESAKHSNFVLESALNAVRNDIADRDKQIADLKSKLSASVKEMGYTQVTEPLYRKGN